MKPKQAAKIVTDILVTAVLILLDYMAVMELFVFIEHYLDEGIKEMF